MKVYRKSLLIFVLIIVFLSGCSSSEYVVRNHMNNIEKIQTCAPYNQESASSEFDIKYLIDEKRAAEIRAYFKENAGLDLDALAASDKSTWEKSVELAVFVAKNIPHDNQKERLIERNAITLWEYSRRVPTGFNCRWHSTILSELLLSIGIKNRFITCQPEDKNDGDCHVVNVVWLPELNKYAMIDSDMVEYVTDENGIPLSLREMRERVENNQPLNINVLPGFENYWVAKPSGINYMHAYWAKNLYWFSAHTVYGFDLEGKGIPEDGYVSLVPPGYECNYELVTSNEKVFWGE